MRAISVVAVILFHLSPNFLPGGFLGVDAFFVISGFLITGILMREHEQGGVRLGEFWSRRCKRLLPAFAVLLVALAAFHALFMPASAAHALGKQSVASLFGVSNLYLRALTQDYWGSSAEWTTLLHTWSLAAEEQFYLLYPIAFWVVAKIRASMLRPAIFISASLSCAYAHHLGASDPNAAFFHTSGRSWELLAGAVAAMLPAAGCAPRSLRIISNVGLAALLTAIVLGTGKNFSPFPGAILAVTGAFIVCWAGKAEAARVEWLALGPFQLLGRSSYSLYLWHWPALVMGSTMALAFPGMYLRESFLMSGLLLGYTSYALIEPIGRRPDFMRRLALPLGLVALGASASLMAFADLRPRALPSDHAGANADPGHLAPIGTPQLLLIGDSHAVRLSSSLGNLAEEAGLGFAKHTLNGVGIAPLPSASPAELDAWRKHASTRDQLIATINVQVVVVACRWDLLGDLKSRRIVADTFERWRSTRPDLRILVVAQPPLLNVGPFDPTEFQSWLNWIRPGAHAKILETRAWSDSSAFISAICRVNQMEEVDSAIATTSSGLTEHYSDYNHLSPAGANLVSREIIGRILGE